MFSRQKTQICEIPKRHVARPAPIRVCPWEKAPKGEPDEKKFDKKGCGDKTQFAMDEYHP